MLGADEEPNSPEGGGVSSSSSTPSHDNGDMMDQNLLENGAFDLSCPESFTQIMEQAEELVISDACSTNCTGNIERKRRRTATDEQEDEEGINNATVEVVFEICRTNVDPRKYYALFGLNTCIDDEEEEGQQKNERGEDDGNQDSEEKENLESKPNEGEADRNQENKNDKEEETEKEEEEETGESQEEEHTENAGDREHNTNHQNSEQQENGDHNDNQDTEQQENGNQESEQDNEGENDENQEENDNEEEEEAEVDEEEKRKADEKGKRPMSEICKFKFIVPKFSKFEKGGPSDTPEGRDQTQQNDNDQLNNEDQYDEDHQVLAILKSMWHFNCNNGYFPYPTSDELHNHIMDSVSNLKILGEDLTNKIIALEDNFNTVRDLDGDNPDGDRPIHREIFDLSMQLWGNSDVEQQNQELYDVNIEQNTSADDLEGWSWW
ncbi:PREDICTED: high mobility group nucleosome-binding domain-containing protein 5-like [Nicotiana attenuata]|uniref:high mobility group nucleosome-binding domain-containing protein 5-like n=1 Tax=Nicotiana attenuata TaxID=49451 RepID=UPI0009057ED2|nr:PREDICTED: high mobility group nucleosome-binding domain-containing protein 5-like [Nicotiana attenuata]